MSGRSRFTLAFREHQDDPAKKAAFTKALFDEVAPVYDRFHLGMVSLVRDAHWKRWLLRRVPGYLPDGTLVDLATGTGSIAFLLADSMTALSHASRNLNLSATADSEFNTSRCTPGAVPSEYTSPGSLSLRPNTCMLGLLTPHSAGLLFFAAAASAFRAAAISAASACSFASKVGRSFTFIFAAATSDAACRGASRLRAAGPARHRLHLARDARRRARGLGDALGQVLRPGRLEWSLSDPEAPARALQARGYLGAWRAWIRDR